MIKFYNNEQPHQGMDNLIPIRIKKNPDLGGFGIPVKEYIVIFS